MSIDDDDVLFEDAISEYESSVNDEENDISKVEKLKKFFENNGVVINKKQYSNAKEYIDEINKYKDSQEISKDIKDFFSEIERRKGNGPYIRGPVVVG
jgi:uncharacterized protein YkuJ